MERKVPLFLRLYNLKNFCLCSWLHSYYSYNYNYKLLVKQKIGKNIYAYEAVSYYDKKKKQPRQKRNYLGRVNPETNEIVRTDRMSANMPKSARCFGLVHLLESMGKALA